MYTLAVDRRSSRYAALRGASFFASRWVVLTLVAFASFSLLLTVAVALAPSPSAPLVGLWLLALGLASAASLSFVFGTTYYQAMAPPLTITAARARAQRATVSVGEAASLALLQVLNGAGSDIATLVQRMFKERAAAEMLQRLELDPERTMQTIADVVLPQTAAADLASAMVGVAHQLGSELVEVEHALGALLLHQAMLPHLREHDLQEQDIGFVIWWQTNRRDQTRRARQWWREEKLLAFTGVGLSWTAGYTPLLDRFMRMPAGNLWDRFLVGREALIAQLINSLARERQSNVLLVGQPGVGRLGIVHELARRVHNFQAHPELNGQRVAYVHVGELLASGTTPAGQVAIISRVLTEMERAGNIIAVLDGLSSVLGEEGEQRVNLTEVLLPFFSSLSVRVVVMVAQGDYHLRLKHNDDLIHFFEVIHVPSATPQATLQSLALAAGSLERDTRLYFPYAALRALVEGTEGILQHIPFPERAFDVLEEAIVTAQAQKIPTLTSEQVNAIVSQKVGVPVGQIRSHERQRLLALEDVIHQRVVNQHQAVAAVARAMMRSRAGTRNRERPIGTFLFLGPTGVGKTETAKALASSYFGVEDRMLRLDMSEFQDVSGVDALIGSAQAPVGRLTSAISDTPFTVVLLDEFEKAHASVQQLFLQVFDEGHLTDIRGGRVSFQHAIIVATSNAGADLIWEELEGGEKLAPDLNKRLTDHIIREGLFPPELLNRFDGVITFTPLSPEHVREIATLMLRKLNARLDAEHGITVAITDDVVAFLMEIGYNPEFGARPMARAIQDTVEYVVARRVIAGHTTPGQDLVLTPSELREAKLGQTV